MGTQLSGNMNTAQWWGGWLLQYKLLKHFASLKMFLPDPSSRLQVLASKASWTIKCFWNVCYLITYLIIFIITDVVCRHKVTPSSSDGLCCGCGQEGVARGELSSWAVLTVSIYRNTIPGKNMLSVFYSTLCVTSYIPREHNHRHHWPRYQRQHHHIED